MTRFSKDDMFRELQVILLHMADHLDLTKGRWAAETFIGFHADPYCDEEPARVDLSTFDIAAAFDWIYDYAFAGVHSKPLPDDQEIFNICLFLRGLPRAGWAGADAQLASYMRYEPIFAGELPRFLTPEGCCQIVADTARARAKLDLGANIATTAFSVRELALLANMTEGAVRNALTRGEEGLVSIPGSKPVSVDHATARRWLLAESRRRFISASPTREADILERLRAVESTADFSALLRARFAGRSGPKDALFWDDLFAEYLDGSFAFDAEIAEGIARTLDLDVPLFVGKALEVSLRRDATP